MKKKKSLSFILAAALLLSCLPAELTAAQPVSERERILKTFSDTPKVRILDHTSGYIAPAWSDSLPKIDPELSPFQADQMLKENKAAEDDKPVMLGAVPVEPAEELPPAWPCSFSDETKLEEKLSALPPLRNQGQYGNCWAHACIALAEFYKDGKDETPIAAYNSVDYSERHLSYFVYHNGTNPYFTQEDDSYLVFDREGNPEQEKETLSIGGNEAAAAAALARWRGAAKETVAPYPGDGAELSDVNWTDTENVELNDAVHLTDAYYLNIEDENGVAHAKNWIREHGAVSLGIDAENAFYDETHHSFYNPNEDAKVNHSVTAVGWDDNFSRNNFTNKPPGDGAWLIRNSWEKPGEDDFKLLHYKGYFYLSYYDEGLDKTAYAFVVRDADEDAEKHNLYYDSQLSEAGWFYFEPVPGEDEGFVEPTFAANVYTVPQTLGSQTISEISFLISDLEAGADTAEAKIYRLGSRDDAPDSGDLIATISGINLPYPGRYSVPVPNAPIVEAGESFSVIITRESGNTVSYECGFIEEYEDEFGNPVPRDKAETGLNEKESYFGSYTDHSFQEIKWDDLYCDDHFRIYHNGNFCINVITENSSASSLRDVDVTLEKDDFTYDGSEKKPAVSSVVLNDVTLNPETDYTVRYTDNINAGTGRVIVKAKEGSGYSGSKTVSFTIKKAANSDTGVLEGKRAYDASGTVDLSPRIRDGGIVGTPITSDPDGILEGEVRIRGKMLRYTLKNAPEKVGKSAEIKVPVSGCTNYLDYTFTVKLTVVEKGSPEDDGPGEDPPEDMEFTLSLNRQSVSVKSGFDVQLTAAFMPASAESKVLWSSGDSSVASVDDTGRVTGKAIGETFISAKAGDQSAVCRVLVYSEQIEMIPEDEPYTSGYTPAPAESKTVEAGAAAKIGGEKQTFTFRIAYDNAASYTGKKIDPFTLLNAGIDTTDLEKLLPELTGGYSAKDLIIPGFVNKSGTSASRSAPYFYGKISLAKDRVLKAAGLSSAQISQLKKAVKAANSELKKKKNRCSYVINKRSLSDGILAVSVKKDKNGRIKTANGKIRKLNYVRLTVPETGKTIRLDPKDCTVKLIDAATGLVQVKGKRNCTGTVAVYVK